MTKIIPTPPPFLKLIAHPLRWAILKGLANTDLTVQEISTLIDQPQNLVSYHLHKLYQAQLVLEHKSIADARQVYFGANFSRLDALFQSAGGMISPALSHQPQPVTANLKVIRVLFLCTHNSARSQMAEGILGEQSHHQLQVFSAGADPTSIHPMGMKVMAEQGIDLRDKTAKSLDIFLNQPFDYVITVCDRALENCPLFPGNPVKIHWSIADPAEVDGSEEEQYAAFKQAADQLTHRILYFHLRILTDQEQ